MRLTYKNYVPKDLSEVYDFLGMMMLCSPTFIDKSERFADRNIETVFHALNAGLSAKKDDLGEEKYWRLMDMSARMRAHFEADPEDKTDESLKGRDLIDAMSEILLQHHRASAKTSSP
jgi:hypothetical protein